MDMPSSALCLCVYNRSAPLIVWNNYVQLCVWDKVEPMYMVMEVWRWGPPGLKHHELNKQISGSGCACDPPSDTVQGFFFKPNWWKRWTATRLVSIQTCWWPVVLLSLQPEATVGRCLRSAAQTCSRQVLPRHATPRHATLLRFSCLHLSAGYCKNHLLFIQRALLFRKHFLVLWMYIFFIAWVSPVGSEPLTLAVLMPCSTHRAAHSHITTDQHQITTSSPG